MIGRRRLIQNKIEYKETHTNQGEDQKSKNGVYKGETRFSIPDIGIRKTTRKYQVLKKTPISDFQYKRHRQVNIEVLK